MALLLTCAIFWNRTSTRSIWLNTDSLVEIDWLHSSFRLYLDRIKFSDWIMIEVWDKSYQPSVTKNNWIINYACKSMKKFHPTTNKEKLNLISEYVPTICRLVLTDLDPDMTFQRYEFSEKDTICDFNSMLELTSTFLNFLDALFVTLALCYNLTQLFVTTQMLYL